MLMSGNIGPTGTRLPKPDLLLLSYTGCYTFMKWFELLREEYDCPTVFLQVPYQGDGRLAPEHRELHRRPDPQRSDPRAREDHRPQLRRGAAARQPRASSGEAEDDLVAVLESAKNRPSPIDAYFGAVYYVGPIFSAFRGTEEGVEYYRELRRGGGGPRGRGAGAR